MSSAQSVTDGLSVRVRVPATSANLGPAFDAAGLALTLYDEVEVRTRRDGSSVHVTGEGSDTVPRDESHLVLRAVRAGLEHAGVVQPPGLDLTAVNRIPHGRGLGSSAAAVVAGLLVARRISAAVDRAAALDDDAVIDLATEFEGHADNVGAAVHGGLTLVWTEPSGRIGSTTLDVDERVHPVLLVPGSTLSTQRARGLIPESVPHRVASFNVGRAALLVTALTGCPSLLLPATDDRLHQVYRAGAFPESMQLVARLREAGLAAAVSGAGPSVVVLAVAEQRHQIGDTPGWTQLALRIDRAGAVLL